MTDLNIYMDQKIVIIPVLNGDGDKIVLDKAFEIENMLSIFGAFVDDRKDISGTVKMDEWRDKGILLKIKLDNENIKKNKIVVIGKDGEKENIKLNVKGFNLFDNNCRSDLPMTRRNVIHNIVKHHSKDQYLCLDWLKTGWKSFVSGGIEQGETLEEAGRKELLEESGYKNLRFIQELECETYDKFYAPHKNKNRFIKSSCCVFELIDDEQEEISEKEAGQHKAVWVDKDEVEKFLSIDAVKFFGMFTKIII